MERDYTLSIVLVFRVRTSQVYIMNVHWCFFTLFKEQNFAYSEQRLSNLKVVVKPQGSLSDAKVTSIQNNVGFLCNYSNYFLIRDTVEIVVTAKGLPEKYAKALLQLLREL